MPACCLDGAVCSPIWRRAVVSLPDLDLRLLLELDWSSSSLGSVQNRNMATSSLNWAGNQLFGDLFPARNSR